jgi:hypothetical protein
MTHQIAIPRQMKAVAMIQRGFLGPARSSAEM